MQSLLDKQFLAASDWQGVVSKMKKGNKTLSVFRQQFLKPGYCREYISPMQLHLLPITLPSHVQI